MRISDWSSDVCSSDLHLLRLDPTSARFQPASQPIERLTGSSAMLTPKSVRQAGKPLVALAFAAVLAAAPGGFLTALGTGAALAAGGTGGGTGGGKSGRASWRARGCESRSV